MQLPGNGKWRYLAILFFAVLLIANDLSLDQEPARILISDLTAGSLAALLALFGLYRPSKAIDWAIGLLAAYLLLAPIVLWAKTATSYLNDNLIGALLFTFAILFSPENRGSEAGGTPPGWSFNPSAFGQRLPVITLAFLAYLFSRYMAFYQLGYIPVILDPVFGEGTHTVITSKISQSLPVPDAGLGSWVYAVEVLMGIHGSKKRWHTIPWFVTLFALLVIPAGLVSILLITLQPLIVGAYCFWCLITAFAMLLMIVFAADEVAATILFLQSVKRRGGSVKQAFWHGDPDYETVGDKQGLGPKLFYGVSFPLNLIVSALIGFWMMFFESRYFDPVSIQAIGATIGALVITFSVIPFAEVLRALRLVNILLGLLFIVLAFYSEGPGIYYHIILGIVLILLAIPKGKIHFSYGDWNKYIV